MIVKRGISPLIATVLIIGFTVAIGAIIILWGGGFIRGIQERSDVSAARAETCAAALLKASGFDQSSPGTIDFLLENRGGVDVESVVVRVTGDSGIESIQVGRTLDSSAKKDFHVNFDPAQVGVVSSVEILPGVSVKGKDEVCVNGVNFEADRPSDIEVSQWDAACGDDNLDLEWEECDRLPDGSLLLPKSPFDNQPVDCASFGYPPGGALGCSEFCTIDISGCDGFGATTCGDGVLDGEEGCDIKADGTPDFFGDTIGDCNTLSVALGESPAWSGDLYCTPDCMIDVSQCSTSGEAIPESCGDDFIDSSFGEECDGTDLGGETCPSQGGTLGCTPDCRLDFSQCMGGVGTITGRCGDGFIDAGEECDGTDLGGQTCASKGFSSGALSCKADCTFDTSACTVCGNNVKEGTEACDGTDLVGKTCSTAGPFDAGTLYCTPECDGFITASCTKCGNGIFEGGAEQCDGTDFVGKTCSSYGWNAGSLACNSCVISTAGCQVIPVISAGENYACATKSNGNMYCWGDNTYGQLGDGTGAQKINPTKVVQTSLGPVVKIATGSRHTCAIDINRKLYCWGSGVYGILGNGAIINYNTPRQVDQTNINAPVDVVSGLFHTCALDLSKGMYCWGYNSNGQIGDGSVTQRTLPVKNNMVNPAKIAAGLYSSCSTDTSNRLYCWGNNAQGQLGLGDTTVRLVPNLVGNYNYPKVGSREGSCAIGTVDNKVYCWGKNLYGQLGDMTTTMKTSPVLASTFTSTSSLVAPSGLHTCAVDPAGKPYCWGYNWYGQLGDSTNINRMIQTPVVTASMGNVKSISSGTSNTCAISTANSIWCWGYNLYGQLGIGSSGAGTDKNVPQLVTLPP